MEGETVVGRNYHTTHGGKGSNMAACAPPGLGAETRFLGKIGLDTFGQGFLDLMAREGVSRDAVPSATASHRRGLHRLHRPGTNLIVIDMGANADSCRDVEAHAEVVRQSTSPLSPLEIPLPTALAAASWRTRRAASSSSIRPRRPTSAAKTCGRFSPSRPTSARGGSVWACRPTTRLPTTTWPAGSWKLGPQHVVLTRGEKGVLWASRDGSGSVPALPVKVVDTVGAGDAFNAGLAVGLAEGRSMLEAIALGVTAASLSTQTRETIESYVRRPEVTGMPAGCSMRHGSLASEKP